MSSCHTSATHVKVMKKKIKFKVILQKTVCWSIKSTETLEFSSI